MVSDTHIYQPVSMYALVMMCDVFANVVLTLQDNSLKTTDHTCEVLNAQIPSLQNDSLSIRMQ